MYLTMDAYVWVGIKDTLTIQSQDGAFFFFSNELKIYDPPQNLHKDVCRSFIHNCPKLGSN